MTNFPLTSYLPTLFSSCLLCCPRELYLIIMALLTYSWLTLVTSAIVFAISLVRILRIGRRPSNYPPGPPTIPILGNLPLMPKRDAHLQFQKWANEYGPVYSLILGTKTLIVLSSDQAVKDLLDKKSAIYSDRQDMYIGQELCSSGLRVLMMVYPLSILITANN